MNGIMIKEDVSSMIIKIRGVDVIVDRDIAKLLNMENKRINEVVKRNINLFNKNNYFQMSEDEFIDWKSQFATSNGDKMGLRKLPYVFTKEGILILSSTLKIRNELVSEIIEEFNKLENNNLVIKGQNINSMIFEIRGKQVIFDSDLAKLYECKNGTKEVNQAVKNNIEKFPENYMFRLTIDEYELLRSKILTSKNNLFQKETLTKGGRRYLPYVFTEQGVVMLATILHTKIAIETSIKIIDAFVVMRHYLNQNGDIYKSITSINNRLDEPDDKIELLLSNFNVREKVYLSGQTYDAYLEI